MDQIMKNKRDLKLVTVALQVTKQVQKNCFIHDISLDQLNYENEKSFLYEIKSIFYRF